MSEFTVDDLAAALSAPMSKLGASEQQVALGLIRQLALGAPVATPDLAAALELPQTQVEKTLEALPAVYRDEKRRVVGFAGLTVLEIGQHRLHVDGRTLSAWCAWDTLFLPELIGATAHVTSRAPDSE